ASSVTIAKTQGKSNMQRLKRTGNSPTPRPEGSWLAGMMIGTVIITMATQAMVLGAGAALQDATLKRL
ncbi:MAG: hypothetical protein ABSC06_37460, partial [Rhodopila sp.]